MTDTPFRPDLPSSDRADKPDRHEDRGAIVTPILRTESDPARVTPSRPEPLPASIPPIIETGDGDREEGVGKIRELLFGGQMREYEVRFGRLEAHLQDEARRSQLEMERRFGQLENYIREEFAKLSSRVQHETAERTEATKQLTETLDSTESRMSSLLQTLDNGLKRDHQELQRRLYDGSLAQEQKLREAREELTAAMQAQSRQINNEKLGSDSLAHLLDEMAARLRSETGHTPDK